MSFLEEQKIGNCEKQKVTESHLPGYLQSTWQVFYCNSNFRLGGI